jgi:hypothetical protein
MTEEKLTLLEAASSGVHQLVGEVAARLPSIEPFIAGLTLGEVRYGSDGNAQAYFGGLGIEYLSLYDQVELRDGAIKVDMFTIDGRDDVDYAEITIKPKAADRTPLEKAKVIRGLAASNPKDFVERTPVQYFFSRRGFLDIPISGRARWLALDPEGNFSEGVFYDRDPDCANQIAMFGEGWTYCWIVEGGRPFKFGELCSPRFIDQVDSVPLGEEGIEELDAKSLTEEFKQRFDYYTSGEQLRVA